MNSIAGFMIKDEIIKEGSDYILYRGFSQSDHSKVVIKVMRDSSNLIEQMEQFKYEFEVSSSLQGNGTVKAYALEKYQNRLAMVLEDFGTYSLKEFLEIDSLTIEKFLAIALSTADALDKIHQKHIIHKNLNPSNILWDERKKLAKIIDFAAASILPREMPEIRDAAFVQQSMLYYMSPEQTGRMNRGIDYRTDYYSLGVVFYQLLTRQVPFFSKDLSELFHYHIAKTPPSPSVVNSEVPTPISDIVMKLLAKTAEERYQSLFGLKEDLKNCLAQLKESGTINQFTLGTNDQLARLQLSEKFYGREEELGYLTNAFSQASTGRARLILVAGYAGIGKSSLVHELYKPLVEKHGYFISGKFDQFKRNIPYMSLTQAFQGFIQQILTLDESQMDTWRERIQQALSPNGKIVLDVIPDLISIIGEQPPVAKLGPSESQNRFNLVFQNFIRALATPEHPLAIFLDDLQWADLPTLKLLENLLLYPESRHFLIIGAYRDNEVEKAHILNTTLDLLRKADFYFNIVTLKPLALEHVRQLLMDTFHLDENAVQALAKICYDKTQGNPFFLNQFLLTLYQEGLFEFNYNDGRWSWDVNTIQQKGITSNVVELMVNKLKSLPSKTQKVIQLASCLGNTFDLHQLALINEKTPKETSNDLWDALDKGLIFPTNSAYKYISNIADSKAIYQFSHDRVQQAAYSLIEDDYRDWLRLKIGRILLKNTPKDKIDEAVIEIVNQANYGVDLITDPEERALLSELNLKAGKKAKASAAYKVALNYLKTGIDFLEKDCWTTQYSLTLELHTETVESAYLATEFADMEAASEAVITHANDSLDKITVYEIEILYLTNHHEYEKAIKIMLSVLRSVGINLPENPTKMHVIWYLVRTKLALLGRDINKLEDQPEMTEPRRQVALRIIRGTAGASYLANPNLFVVSGFEAILLLIKYGNTPQAARSYVVYGHILCGALNQIDIGYQFGTLSLKLCKLFNSENIMAQVWMVHGVFIKHWHDTLRDSINLTFDSFQKGLETGDIEYAGYSIAGHVSMRVLYGDDLVAIEKEANKYKNLLLSIEQRTAYLWIASIHQAAQNLLGKSNEIISLKSSDFDETSVLQELLSKKDNVGGILLCTEKMLLCYLFNDYQEGYKWAQIGNNFVSAIGVFILPVYYFLFSLICIMLYPQANDKERKTYLKLVKTNQKKSRLWAKHAPMNYEHKYCLVNAELARLLGNTTDADVYYDRAIELASKNQFLSEEALANELAAKHYLEQGNERIAKAYINDAYICYMKWGAVTKVKQLEKQYSHLLGNVASIETPHILAESLDLVTVMKASQTIIREIELESLLTKMMHIVIENAGAQKGYLLLMKEKKWYIEAESTIDKKQVAVLKSIPIEGKLPLSIIQYVIRTNLPLVLDDAAHDDQFSSDPYIKQVQPKSIFCLPLLNQGLLNGLLYMENNLTVKAFTQDRLNLLNILSAQIVIAIDNAQQYSYIKSLSKAYERFVPQEYLHLLRKKNITAVKLGDQMQQDMTIMVCDIRNFTTMAEKMSPQESMDFLNEYLSLLEPVILEKGGFIDKYIGDGFIAVYTSSSDALDAAIDILRVLDSYNSKRILEDKNPINIGIGLASGLATIGTVGVARRMQTSIISQAVDTADSIEELTKVYHVPLLITEATYERLRAPDEYAIRKLDRIKITGKQAPVVIYEVFNNETETQVGLKNFTMKEFEQGTALYQEKKFAQAIEIFQYILQINSLDLPAIYFLEQCNLQGKEIV